jgi:molybdenum cofactor cytidylyltransferase
MLLNEALPVSKGDVVSLVGAGGKTTAMYRLGQELAAQGWRVITTTTTMIRRPLGDQVREVVVEEHAGKAVHQVAEALLHHGPVALASRWIADENKLKGIAAELVAELRAVADAVIVEADGARGLPLKAPAAYEPVVPDCTTVLIPLAGISAVGRRLTAQSVHRPELVAELTGLEPGQVVTPDAIARLLVHPRGGLKNAPPDSRVIPLINQVDDELSLASAREIAAGAKSSPRVDRVLIGAVADDTPVKESWRRVAAVVLAAGESTRMGTPKQLLPVNGVSLIEHVLDVVLEAQLDEVVVVLGSSAEEIASRIPTGCRITLNADWRSGIGSSIRAGLMSLSRNTEAALFVLADQPGLTASALGRIVQAYYRKNRSIVVPFTRGQRTSPALFDRRHFAELSGLSGDVGGKAIMELHPEQILEVDMPNDDLALDVDTPADYERFLRNRAQLR